MNARTISSVGGRTAHLGFQISRQKASVGFGLIVTAAVLALAATSYGQSSEATTAPAPALTQPQYSTITSTNNVVEASRVPVVYNGKTYYEDVTFTMTPEVSTSGEVTIETKTTAVTSPGPSASAFKAGTYVGPSNVNGGKNYIVVSGPSALPGGGAGWTLTTNSESSGATYPSTAVWYVEPIAHSPLATRLNAAKITNLAYSYGQGDSGSSPNTDWPNNSLLGFSQVGNTLSISSFSYGNGYTDDSGTPTDTITYTLVVP